MVAVEENARVHLLIEGRVQGVFFRASAQAEASRLGLTGWVRNRLHGAVEIVAEGERKKLDDWIAWCRHGPRGAEVENVRIEWEEFSGEFSAFRITR
jgi:acylphosphatase